VTYLSTEAMAIEAVDKLVYSVYRLAKMFWIVGSGIITPVSAKISSNCWALNLLPMRRLMSDLISELNSATSAVMLRALPWLKRTARSIVVSILVLLFAA
jgi:hypothetical protein